MRDRVGGFIGSARQPTTSSASGLWTLRDHANFRSLATWPSFQAPPSVSGLQLWYDFSDLANLRNTSNVQPTATGQQLNTFIDKSGQSRDMSVQSTYVTITYPDQNTLPALNGTGGYLFNNSTVFPFVHNAQSTIFFAMRPGTTANPDTSYFLFGTNNSTTQSVANTGFQFFWADALGQGRDNAIGFASARNDASMPAALNYTSNGSVVANQWSIVAHAGDMASATASERSKFYINGGTAQANNTYTSAAIAGNSSSGLIFGNNSFAGRFGELLIYNRILTDTERSTITTYLASKWGIAI